MTTNATSSNIPMIGYPLTPDNRVFRMHDEPMYMLGDPPEANVWKPSDAQAAKLDRDSRVEVFTCPLCGGRFNVRWSDGDLLQEQCVGCDASAPALLVRLACEPKEK